MKNKNYNEDTTCKAMQNAALAQLLKDLKELKSYRFESDLRPIFNAIVDVLESYDCIPCTCLQNRAESIADDLDYSDINPSNIKAFISELETFLNSGDFPSNFIKI